MKQSERLVLLEENKQEIERLNAELQRRKAIVGDLLDGCDHTDGNGSSLVKEMITSVDSISTHASVCDICGAWLNLQTITMVNKSQGGVEFARSQHEILRQ